MLITLKLETINDNLTIYGSVSFLKDPTLFVGKLFLNFQSEGNDFYLCLTSMWSGSSK